MELNIKKLASVKLKEPVLITGFPGVGNVSKLALDFITDNLGAEEIYEITSDTFPPAVLITDDDEIYSPSIQLYALKRKRATDLLLATGDVQPSDEQASYQIAEKIVELAKGLGCKEVLTLGGVGRKHPVKKPRLYTAASTKEYLNKFKKRTKEFKLHSCDTIANIMGLTGLVLGGAKSIGIDAVTVLIDTFAHPKHFGIEESKQILQFLKKLFDLKINPVELDEDIEQEKKDRKAISQALKQRKLAEMQDAGDGDVSYIG